MRSSPFFAVVLSLIGFGIIAMALPNLGPTIRAARADGVPGVFTAREVQCVQHPGHESCTWWGEFRSHDGTRFHPRIALYGADRDMMRAGQTTAAVDVDRPRKVYSPGGSLEWIFVTALLLVGVAIIGLAVRDVLRGRSPRRQVATSADTSAASPHEDIDDEAPSPVGGGPRNGAA